MVQRRGYPKELYLKISVNMNNKFQLEILLVYNYIIKEKLFVEIVIIEEM